MLPATFQFFITRITCAIILRMQRKLYYMKKEVRFLKI